jgi:hypothetical protein
VEVFGVVAGERDFAEEAPQQPGARLGDLVEDEPRPGQLGEDGEQPGAGGGLQNDIGRCQRGGLRGDETERDGRGELLQPLGFLASMLSIAAAEPARARIAAPNLRRNSTCAASSAS